MKKNYINGFGLVFSIVLIAVSLWDGYNLYRTHYSYEKTTAKILKVEMETIETAGGEIGSTIKTFRPKITYEYLVGDTKFRNNVFSTSNQGLSEIGSANKLKDSFKIDETVDVFYDPIRPENSVLVLDFDSNRFYLVLSILFCGIFLLFYLLYSITKTNV